jgi:DNA-binding IclR family transcriptional regulator
MGRSILAFLGPDVIDSVLTQTGRGPLSGRPPPARAMLRQELLEIKERGYAIYLDPEYIHAAGVAAPVYDASGQVLGCLGVSMPYSRFQSAMAETMGLSIVGQANQLSDLLRGKGLRG